MTDEPNTENCFFCKQSFRFGPQVYDGRRIPAWDVVVCQPCYSGNWDGIDAELHPQLVKHLKAKGIKIEYNKGGWIPWPDDL